MKNMKITKIFILIMLYNFLGCNNKIETYMKSSKKKDFIHLEESLRDITVMKADENEKNDEKEKIYILNSIVKATKSTLFYTIFIH